MPRLLLLLILPAWFFQAGNPGNNLPDPDSSRQSWIIPLAPADLPDHLASLMDALRQPETSTNPSLADSLMLQLGFGLYQSKQYTLAESYFMRVARSADTISPHRLVWALFGQALISYDMLDNDTTLRMLESCKMKAERASYPSDPQLLFNIYHYLSLTHYQMGELEKADQMLLLALQKAPDNEKPTLFNERVRILAQLGAGKEAFTLASENLVRYKRLGNPYGICIGYTTAGSAALNLGLSTMAQEYWDSCFNLAIEKKQYQAVIWISRNLAGYYKTRENSEKALLYLEYNSAYKDSLTAENSRVQMALEMARSRTTRKQQELSLLTVENKQVRLTLQRNRILLVSIALALVLLGLGALLIHYRDKMREQRLLLDLNRYRLNPHFIFNSLNSLQKSIINGDFEASNRYLTRFSGLMRETLDQSLEPFITLHREQAFLRNYLELEQMRFDHQFSFTLEQDAELVDFQIQIPSMVIQPILENSIWHGLLPLDSPGLIRIFFSWHTPNRLLHCTITDNGIGRQAARNLKSGNSGPFTSRSTSIITERIELMRKHYRVPASISFSDLTDNEGKSNGTQVDLVLPVRMEPS